MKLQLQGIELNFPSLRIVRIPVLPWLLSSLLPPPQACWWTGVKEDREKKQKGGFPRSLWARWVPFPASGARTSGRLPASSNCCMPEFPATLRSGWGIPEKSVCVCACVVRACVPVCVCVYVSHSVVSDSETPWTVAHQASLSKGLSRQEYWSGLPFPSPTREV